MQAAYRCQRLTKGEKMSFFSVVIPAYNCEKYLTAAVESVRNQPVKDVDDIYAENAMGSQLLEECRKGYDMIMCSSLMANVDRDRYRTDIRSVTAYLKAGRRIPYQEHLPHACIKNLC